uniref:Uncharacterized protein n=1 Tax=Brassica oleracea var. oleracea TaxID=109376 RepID=A0A0D3D7P7_BRAOL
VILEEKTRRRQTAARSGVYLGSLVSPRGRRDGGEVRGRRLELPRGPRFSPFVLALLRDGGACGGDPPLRPDPVISQPRRRVFSWWITNVCLCLRPWRVEIGSVLAWSGRLWPSRPNSGSLSLSGSLCSVSSPVPIDFSRLYINGFCSWFYYVWDVLLSPEGPINVVKISVLRSSELASSEVVRGVDLSLSFGFLGDTAWDFSASQCLWWSLDSIGSVVSTSFEVCSGCSSDSLVPRWLLMKQYKEVGVLGLPMKVSLEKGALVSGVGLSYFWSFVLGVLVLAWYRERWVQSAGSSKIFGLTAIPLIKDCLQIQIYE